ncbi:MAG TPA: hypothetical protein VM144_04915 [Aestuariivirga sp.]|nr:hypothetical protein [Aestuariivirga sp.]
MLLPSRITDLIKLVLLAAFAVFFCASPGLAGNTSVQLAQLSLDIGGVKLGKKKCRGKVECLEQQKHKNLEQQEHKKKNSNENDKHKLLNKGIGIVIELPKASKKKKQPAGTPVTVKKKNDATTVKKEKKVAPPAAKPDDDPKDKPVFVPPEFPVVAMNDCEECYDLWDSILWYEWIIGADAKKLFDRKRDLEERQAEIDELRAKLPKAGSIDKVYYNQEIARHTEYIEAIDELNDELEKLIAEEWLVLRERIDQYVECANRHCPKLVKTEQIEVTPVVATTPPEEPPATPAETAAPEESGSGFEIGTTLKLDGGLGGKTIDYGTTTYSTPPPPLPNSRPPEDPNVKICGPDITPAVIKTLKKIREEYNSNPDKQAAACRSLIDPRSGGSAWDIGQLSPAVAVPKTSEKENPFQYEKEYDAWVQRDEKGGIKDSKQPWFTGESAMCAIPRNDPVCAPTVEFFGICEHAQVVNYVQWRFMLGLCGGGYPYVGPALHKAWNTVQYGGNAPKQAQDNMSEVAKKILDKLNENENDTDFSDIKDALVGLDSGLNKEIRECELKCPIKIDREFGYVWTGLTRPRPVETVRLDKDLNKIADEGLEKLKFAAEEAGYSTSLRPSSVLGNILKALGLN